MKSENTEKKDSLLMRVMTWLTWTTIASVPLSSFLQHRMLQWSELMTEILLLPALIVFLALLGTFQKMDSSKGWFSDLVDDKSDAKKPKPSSSEKGQS